jgi:EmrB/QacA subfamily drug resistance transporter
MTQTHAAASTGTDTRTPVVHRTAILAIIVITYFMIILDNSIIFTGLPSIQASMDFTPTGLTWVQDAYTLVFGGLLLLGARAGDIVGRRRLFIIGLVIFSVASLMVGAAPTGGIMVAARALQGVGAAILAPLSLSLLTATFPEGRERDRAVALYAAVAGIGASAGMVIGGVLADLISWRAGFFLNLPIGAVMIVLAVRYLVELPRVRGRFDAIGAVTATLGVGSLIYGIISSSEVGWVAPRTIVALALGVLLLVALVMNERRAAQPIMPLRLFASRQRSGAYAIRFLYLGAMMGFFYLTTQFLQEVFGWSPLQAGLGFLPMTIVNFAVALSVPRILARIPVVVVLGAGVIATFAGMLWLSRVDAGDAFITGIALPMVLIGLGQGLAFAPLTSYALTGITGPDAGAASGLLNTAHQLGSSLGLAVLVAVGTSAAPGGTDAVAVMSGRVEAALTGSSVMLALAFALVLLVVLPGDLARRRAAAAEPAAA